MPSGCTNNFPWKWAWPRSREWRDPYNFWQYGRLSKRQLGFLLFLFVFIVRLAHWPYLYRRFVIGPGVATPGMLPGTYFLLFLSILLFYSQSGNYCLWFITNGQQWWFLSSGSLPLFVSIWFIYCVVCDMANSLSLSLSLLHATVPLMPVPVLPTAARAIRVGTFRWLVLFSWRNVSWRQVSKCKY